MPVMVQVAPRFLGTVRGPRGHALSRSRPSKHAPSARSARHDLRHRSANGLAGVARGTMMITKGDDPSSGDRASNTRSSIPRIRSGDGRTPNATAWSSGRSGMPEHRPAGAVRVDGSRRRRFVAKAVMDYPDHICSWGRARSVRAADGLHGAENLSPSKSRQEGFVEARGTERNLIDHEDTSPSVLHRHDHHERRAAIGDIGSARREAAVWKIQGSVGDAPYWADICDNPVATRRLTGAVSEHQGLRAFSRSRGCGAG